MKNKSEVKKVGRINSVKNWCNDNMTCLKITLMP